jgi:hypothetical protein
MRNNAASTRGRPFPAGNPGRQKGTRNKANLAAEALLDGEVEALTRKAVDMALAGDTTALRLCLERIAPPRKDRPVPFTLPKMECADDAVVAGAALLAAVAAGELTPMEANELGRLVESYAKALEVSDLARRLDRLEQESGKP